MVRSMTAFARRERHGEWGSLSIELRSVNHRFFEASVRMPEELRPLEPAVRERLASALRRGKVDCNIRHQPPENIPGEPQFNRDLALKLAHVSREIDTLLYNPAPVNSFDVLRWPGVLQMPAPDTESLQQEMRALLGEALQEMDAVRLREGEKLKEVVVERCGGLEKVVAAVRERVPEIVERQRQRLQDRLAELKVEPDIGRLEQELAYMMQKMDVDEEIQRLETHIHEVRRVVGLDEPIGRRLDFLMQELNREANTLASKSADSGQTQWAVELKVLIEQIREQVQNIE